MPIKISRFRGQVGKVRIGEGADAVHIDYRSGRTTPDWLDSLSRLPLRRALSEVLVSWDVLGEDDLPLQPPAETDPIWQDALPVLLALSAKFTAEKRIAAASDAAIQSQIEQAAQAGADSHSATVAPSDPDVIPGVALKSKRMVVAPAERDDDILAAAAVVLDVHDPVTLGLCYVGATTVAGDRAGQIALMFGKADLTDAFKASLIEDMFIAAWGVVLGEIPQSFLRKVLDAVLEDMRPGNA